MGMPQTVPTQNNLRPQSHLQAETEIQANHISQQFSLPDKSQIVMKAARQERRTLALPGPWTLY